MIKKRQSKPRVHRVCAGFSLIELLVAVFVVTIMVLILGQLMGHATTVTRTGNKHIDTDTQARVILDRMAIDIAQMLKRTDIDYYVKGSGGYTGHGNGHAYGHKVASGQQGSDQIAFFSQVPGYNSTSYSSTSPLSLIAYRINSLPASPAYLRMERMGKGLLWNGMFNNTVSNPNNKNSRNIWYPITFAPGQIGAVGGPTGPWATPWGPWAAAITNDTSGNLNNSGSQDPDYEVNGANVFRFEYYYLLTNGTLSDIPWDTAVRSGVQGMRDVTAIVVVIAVVDPKSKALLDAVDPAGAKLNRLNGADGQPPLLVDHLRAFSRHSCDAASFFK